MNAAANQTGDPHTGASSIQTYARAAGVLFLLSIIGGAFGEFYVPSKLIVSGDATATAHNIVTMNSMFRLGFAGYLLEAICDISLTLVFYVLLKPVNRNIALLAAFFGLVATSVFAGGELFFFGSSLILSGTDFMKTFTPDQINSLAMLSLKFYGLCAGIFMAFYGIGAVIRGYLMYRSGFLPRFLGALFMLAGVGFIARNFVLVLAPAYESDFFLAPMPIAGVALTVWMLVKGVDVKKWQARAVAGN